jgi:DNA-binding CsgD family transcriptional regulator
VLVGRESERQRLDALLAAARVGRSEALVLGGEAGIGKSALLEDTVARAEDFRVLRARGFESESELAFAGLADLLRPVVELLAVIPPPQASALAGALSLGPPSQGDRFAVCAATLSLLAAAADDGAPVLVVVDDAQWLDPSTTQAVLFANRRLDAEPVAVLIAMRDGGGNPLIDRAGLPRLTLAGLDGEAAAAVVSAGAAGRAVDPVVAERLVEATGGNPLALTEIPSLLTDAQLNGAQSLPDLPAAPSVERAFATRVDALPIATQEALIVAAASDTGDLDELVAALAVSGGGGLDALDAAERVGLVSLTDDRLEFAHPLLRAAVYRGASAGQRRSAHEALARAGQRGAAGGRAWHLAAAAQERSEEAAMALEEAALETRQRGGVAEASLAFERAAELSADDEERARRLREAASDARLAGRVDHALELLDEALEYTSDPDSRARIQHLRGVIEMWDGSAAAAHDLLVREAALIEATDRGRAAGMLTAAAWSGYMSGHLERGLATARRAHELAAGEGEPAETTAEAVLGIGLLLVGDSKDALPLLTAYHRQLLEGWGAGALPYHVVRPAGQVLMWFERYDEARETLSRTIAAARERSALGGLPYALATLSEIDYRTGDWTAAYAGASEAVRIAEDTGQESLLSYALVCLAQVEAARGLEEDCRTHTARAAELAAVRAGAALAYAEAALGLLELGLGRTDASVEHLTTLSGRTGERRLREPGVIQWVPDLVEAHIRAGHPVEAETTLAEFEAVSREADRTWALAAAARCRGLLAEDDAFETVFDEALELHDRTPTPFELARTQLCLGERRRRARRRADAREPLRSALAIFERLGATPWAERARRELEATGESVRARDPAATDELTPTELQVALLVGRGATNKEAGAALFLSPKTIETHLGRVYRKVGVRSRTELAHALATAES